MLTGRRELLVEHGIVPLTGESCGLGLRVLFDLTREGAEIIRDFLGLPALTLAPPWNDGIGSITLPRDMLRSLIIFIMATNGAIKVIETESGDLYGPESERSEGLLKEMVRVKQVWVMQGTSPDKTRNVHAFSGRVA